MVTTTSMMNCDPSPEANEVKNFLAEYAAILLRCGATCIRIEKNLRRMAEAFGMYVGTTIMPTYILLSIRTRNEAFSYCSIERPKKGAINFNLNTQLSKLSWEVADGKLTFCEARQRLDEIAHSPHANRWVVLLLVALANASFCRLFGGDGKSMAVVFVATLCGFLLRQEMLRHSIDLRFVVFCSAFLSSVIGATGHIFDWGATPDVALATSVLYLIPGVPYINAVSDMLDGHYICSFSRFMNAVILTFCLSLGLCCGLLVMEQSWF